MIQQIRIENWLLEVDIDMTQKFYEKEIEVCECLYCRNFIEAIKQLDSSVMTLFSRLGFNLAKPGHLSDYQVVQEGTLMYIGNYHLVGKLLEGELCKQSSWTNSNTTQIQNFTIGFSKDLEFVPEEFPNPVLQLDFVAIIPWILDEIPDSI